MLRCLLAFVLLCSPAARSDDSRPAIVFILADDMAYNAFGRGGNDVVRTPAIDRLCDEGALFTHAFNPGSWTPAVCQASRTMLETGLSVWKAQQYRPQRDKAVPVWSRLMKEAGYETCFTGKWHIPGLDPQKLFDHTGTVRPGMPAQTEAGYARRFVQGEEDAWRPDDPSRGGYWQGGRHWSEVTADEACDMIRQVSRSKKPFFLYVSFNAPHDPRQSPKRFLDMYPMERMDLPPGFLAQYPYCRDIGAGPGLRDERLAPFPRSERSIRVNRREYYALISHLDEQVGRILSTLDSCCTRPVYVIFTSDQGLSVGDHGFMGKQNLYDPSIRVPFIVKGPGIRPGMRLEHPVYLQSAMPTCLELAGLTKRDDIIYPSLLPWLHGTGASESEGIYGAMLPLQRMIRTDDWKMLVYPRAGVVRLYDRRRDPHERHDVANDPAHGTVINDLFAQLTRLQKRHDDALDLEEIRRRFMAAGSE